MTQCPIVLVIGVGDLFRSMRNEVNSIKVVRNYRISPPQDHTRRYNSTLIPPPTSEDLGIGAC